MERALTYMAAAETQDGVLGVLGIDWMLLLLQTLAFLILLWFLAKFVYPPLTAMLDRRDEQIEAGAKAAKEAEEQANQTKTEVEKLLKQARADAKDIVATAKEEAAANAEAADKKAKARADRIVEDAHEQIDKDIIAARKALHNETLSLVAQATETVVGKTVDARVDDKVMANALKEAK